MRLSVEHQVRGRCGHTEGLDLLFVLDQIFDLHQEPGVDHVHAEYVFDSHAGAEGVCHVPDTLGARHCQFALEHAHAFRIAQVELRVQAANANFQTAQGFLQGFLEGSADGHDFADRFHLRGQAWRRPRRISRRRSADLGDDVVDGTARRTPGSSRR